MTADTELHQNPCSRLGGIRSTGLSASLGIAEHVAGQLGEAGLGLRPRPGSVLVADRETEAGGAPRHCFHTGFGLRDLHRVMTGPAYARALTS